MPGKRVRLLVRGLLPYRVRLEMECLEAERPRRLVSRVGDLAPRREPAPPAAPHPGRSWGRARANASTSFIEGVRRERAGNLSGG
ncbi:MAG: hypothetical protein AB7O78_16685 [Thermoleophilia bacterium]